MKSPVKGRRKAWTRGCTVTTIDGAATNGHLDVVKWLHANRPEVCTIAAMNSAAIGGHMGGRVGARSMGGTPPCRLADACTTYCRGCTPGRTSRVSTPAGSSCTPHRAWS